MKRIVLVLLLCYSQAFATNYYISSSEGLIGNDGLSPATPFRTDNINSNPYFRFHHGDSVLLKRGDVFSGVFMSFSSGDATGDIYYGAYGTGAKPIISPLRPIPQNHPYTQFSDSVYRIIIDTVGFDGVSRALMLDYTPRVFLNGIEYQRAKDSTDVNRFRRVCFRNDDYHFLYIYSPTGNPNSYYTSVLTPNIDKSIFDISGSSYVTIENIDVQGGQGACFELLSCNYVTIKNCNIGWNSVKQGIRVRNCHFISINGNSFDSGERIYQYFIVGGEGGDATSIGKSTDVDVFNNTYFNYRHAAWAVEQFGLYERDSINRVHVYNNIATQQGLDYSRGFVLYSNEGKDVVIENNIIRGFPVQCQVAFVNAIIRNNLFDSTKNRADSQFAPTGVALLLGHSFFKAQGMRIVGNTFSNNETTGIYLSGQINDDGSYANVQNNFIDSNNFKNNGYHPQQMYWTIHNLTDKNFYPDNIDLFISDNQNVLTNTYAGNNFIKRTSTETPIYYGRDASNNYLKTVSGFNSLNGSMGDVITGNGFGVTRLKIINRKIKTQL